MGRRHADSVARYLGLLSASRTQFEEAAAHYETALAMNRRLRARPWLAHTQEDYVRMLLEQGGPRNVKRARSLLSDALAAYSELGMHSFAAGVRAISPIAV